MKASWPDATKYEASKGACVGQHLFKDACSTEHLFGILLSMVFCRECHKKVDDCEHFVAPLGEPHVPVFDPKIKTLAYSKHSRILEIGFKNGQTWQLAGIAPAVYDELLHATISSFLKFLAHRFKASPVRTAATVRVPESEPCPACRFAMKISHQTLGKPTRVLWHCERCNQSLWMTYSSESVRERVSQKLHRGRS